VNEGHYYLQAEKHGSIFRAANYRKNEHFQVQARWILSLWRLRKLDRQGARAEAIAGRDRASAIVREIDAVEALEYTARCKAEEQQARGGAPLLPFKPPVASEVLWLAQYGWGATVAEAVPATGGRPRLRRYKKHWCTTGPAEQESQNVPQAGSPKSER
jgi:hypothetical protein